jgi:hypothetical protein
MKHLLSFKAIVICGILSAQEPFFPSAVPANFPEGEGRFAVFAGFPSEGAWCGWWTPSAGTRKAITLPVSYTASRSLLGADVKNDQLCIHIFRQDNWMRITECFRFNAESQTFIWEEFTSVDAVPYLLQELRQAKMLEDKINAMDTYSGLQADSRILSEFVHLIRPVLRELQTDTLHFEYKQNLLQTFFYSIPGQEVLSWRKRDQAEEFFTKYPGASAEEWLDLLDHWQRVLGGTSPEEYILVTSVLSRNRPDNAQYLKQLALAYEGRNMHSEAVTFWRKYIALAETQGIPITDDIRKKVKP